MGFGHGGGGRPSLSILSALARHDEPGYDGPSAVDLRNALTTDALAASPGDGAAAPAGSVGTAAATTDVAAAAAAAAAAPAAAGLAAADPLHRIPTHDHRGVPLSDYERQRLANIAANRRVLEALTMV